MWNDLATIGITPIRGITKKRKSHLQARFREYGYDSFSEVIEQIKQSQFLQGKHNGKPWQITFDWLILPSNYLKVLEGNYKTGNKSYTGSAFDHIDIGE
jgi:hypothetical protein